MKITYSFYRELYPMGDDPLFHIHLNVDYPFKLTGILYFPKIRNNFEIQKNKIQLYCNQVFVTDSVEGIVPDFLTLLHGVIDSLIYLLTSQEATCRVTPMSKRFQAISPRRLQTGWLTSSRRSRENFEKKWDDLKLFIEYGMITEEKFFEKASKFALFKNTEGKVLSLLRSMTRS
ncbi:MAG: hypothetical protein MZV63_19975 [Marinilabiliales bacterium]|nr:hypothetical protein [Marinilabiliales bacterium]